MTIYEEAVAITRVSTSVGAGLADELFKEFWKATKAVIAKRLDAHAEDRVIGIGPITIWKVKHIRHFIEGLLD